MAQIGKFVLANTVAATQWRSALAQNAAENLSLNVASLGVGLGVNAVIRSIRVLSLEDLQWEFWFFNRNTYDASVDPDTNGFVGSWWFGVSGRRIGAAGLYHYYIDGLMIPYQDLDMTSRLHVALINRSAASKTAGNAGAIQVRFGLEMTLGV